MSKFFRSLNGKFYPVKDIKNLFYDRVGYFVSVGKEELRYPIAVHTFNELLNDNKEMGSAVPAPTGWQCIYYDGKIGQHPLIAFGLGKRGDDGSLTEYLSPWGAYDYALAPDGRVYSNDRMWTSLDEWLAEQQQEKAPPVRTDEA